MSVRKSLAWAFTGQLATVAINFVGSVVIARLLTPTEMGVYALAQATAGMLAVISAFGVVSYVIREAELSDQKIASAFTINAAVNLCLAAMVFASSHWLDDGNPTVRLALKMLALPPIFSLLEFRPFAMLQREQKFQKSSIIVSVATLISVLATVALALSGASSLSMPIAAIAAAMFRAVAFNLALPHQASFRISFAEWRGITSFGLRMITIRGAAILAQRSSEMILGRMLGLTALGIYTRASILSSQIFFNIYGTATQVVFTEMSRAHRENGTVRDTFLRGLDFILAFMWPLLIGVAILARPAIHILYGPNWIAAALPLSILMVAQAISLSFGMNWELFVLRDETAKQTKYELFRMALGVLTFSIGASFSLTGASMGRIVEGVIGAIMYLPQMTTLSGAKASHIGAIYSRGALLTAAAVTPSIVIMASYDWSETTPLPVIATGIALGVACWFVVLQRLDHPLFGEMKSILQRTSLRFGRTPA